MKQAREAFSKIDTKAMTSKIHRAVNFTKKEMQNLKKSSAINEIAIKVNNKEAKKQITQLEKEIDSLQTKINASQTALKNVNFKINGIKDDTSLEERLKMATKTGHKSNYTEQEYGSLDNNIDKSLSENSNYTNAIKQQEILKKNIEEYKSQIDIAKKKLIELSQVSLPKRTITGAKTMNIEKPDISAWDVLRNKIEQIKPVIQAVKQCFKNVFGGNEDPFDLGESGNQIRLIEIKIDKLESKIKGAQEGKIKLSDEDIAKAEVELDRLYNKKQELEKGNKGNFFSSFFSSLKKVTPSMNSISGMTIKIKNTIKQWGGGMKQGLGHVLKYAGALVSLRSIYSTLSSSASSWLSSQNAQAQQLSANIDYMKYAMGSVFAPVIEYVTNLIYNLMRAVQSLVYAFSGVNIFAKATASSMKSASGSASKASKSLAGIHNEINNVSDNESGGSGSTSPSMDLSQMDNTPNSIIDAIKNGNWNEIGTIIGQKLNDAMSSIPWDKIQETVRNIGTGIAQTLNGFIATIDWTIVGGTLGEGINTIIEFSYTFVTNFKWDKFGKAIGNSINGFFKKVDWGKAGKTLGERIKGIFDSIKGFFETFDWNVVIDGLLDFIEGFDWNGVSDTIFEALGSACASFVNLGMIIGEKINEAMDNAKEYFKEKIEECGGNVVEGIFKGIGDALANIGQWINEHIFQPFIEGFKNAFGIHSPSTVMEEQGNFIMQGLLNGITNLVDKVKQIWENIKNTAVQKFTDIKDSISNIWQQVINNTSETWQNIKNKVKEGVQGAWEGITSVFSNIPNWFKDKFSQAWQAVKNVFSTGGKIFDGIKEGILSGLKSVINAIIRGINKVVKIPFNGINSALQSIKNVDIMGLKPFDWLSTIAIPQIPELAKGNVAYDETLAIFGEYAGASNNPEITTPQNIMRDTFEDVLSDFNGNNGQPLHVTIQYLGKEIFDETIDYINSKTRRTGKNTIVTVGG